MHPATGFRIETRCPSEHPFNFIMPKTSSPTTSTCTSCNRQQFLRFRSGWLSSTTFFLYFRYMRNRSPANSEASSPSSGPYLRGSRFSSYGSLGIRRFRRCFSMLLFLFQSGQFHLASDVRISSSSPCSTSLLNSISSSNRIYSALAVTIFSRLRYSLLVAANFYCRSRSRGL